MKTFKELINSRILVLVHFSAVWCTYRESMSSILVKVKEEQEDAIQIVEVDVDENNELSLIYSIQTLPTLLIFKDGKQVWRQSGIIDADELSKVIDMFK